MEGKEGTKEGREMQGRRAEAEYGNSDGRRGEIRDESREKDGG